MSSIATEGQVCDRCRIKKIRCDGASSPGSPCSNCATAGVHCETSAKLRRKTKARGYAARNNAQSAIEKLERENSELRIQLERQSHAFQRASQQVGHISDPPTSNATPPVTRPRRHFIGRHAHEDRVSVSGESDATSARRADAFVIKHMGRMVHDQADIGRFAGSTTGVHFVVSVEEICRRTRRQLRAFPESCFRLYLVNTLPSPRHHGLVQPAGGGLPEGLQAILDRPIDVHLRQLDNFTEMWDALCPVIPRETFKDDVEYAKQQLRRSSLLDIRATVAVTALLSVILVNEVDEEEEIQQNDPTRRDHLLALILYFHPEITSRGDLASLQCLGLYSLFLQITNQTYHFVQVNGVLVRIAQSLGMHRHARRFRFTESETELRKRIWWWIYSFDQYTSLVHGLPRLIQDTDVDNDMPIDCELHELSQSGLTHPLPGEPTPVYVYVRYIQISKIVSMILGQLYTTTQRREGERKIANLDRELRGWHQNLAADLKISPSLENAEGPTQRGRLQRFTHSEKYTLAWLDLMANYALILIHRPALTFDETTSRFRESLNVAVKASTTLLHVANATEFHRQAINGAPFGPSVVFQSALTLIFNRSLGDQGALTTVPAESTRATVAEAVQLLQEMQERIDSITAATATATGMATAGGSTGSLQPAIELLQNLSAEFLSATTDPNEPIGVSLVSTSSQIYEQQQGFSTTATTATTTDVDFLPPAGGATHDPMPLPFANPTDQMNDVEYWNQSALESLNHLDIFAADWEGQMGFFGD